MANAWFRMYAEFANDPKVQMMGEAMQRRYLMLMCLRCSNALVTLHDDEIAFQLRISSDELAETKRLFVAKGFIDESWNLLNWDKRQFASDSSKARVAKHRALQKEKLAKSGNDAVTLQKRKANALDTDTDTDIEEDKSSLSPGKPDDQSPAEQADKQTLPPCPHIELIDLYAKHLPSLPQPRPEMWSGVRAKALAARWRWVLTAKKRDGERYATSKQEAVEFFGRFFGYVAKSDFLSGRNGQWTACDLGWLSKEANFAKVIQGNYENKTSGPP